MKVVVGPGERDLDDVVEVGEGTLRADDDSPPDHRVNAPNPDMNPVRGKSGFLIHGYQQLNNLRVLPGPESGIQPPFCPGLHI
jgi:hypothetical protein